MFASFSKKRRRNAGPPASKPGFTILELLVSIALLILLVFGAAELFSRGLSVERRAERITLAVTLAQSQIETLRGMDYQNITVGAFEPPNTVFEDYVRRTDTKFIDPATLADSPDDLGLLQVDITVTYPAVGGQKSVELSTFIARL